MPSANANENASKVRKIKDMSNDDKKQKIKEVKTKDDFSALLAEIGQFDYEAEAAALIELRKANGDKTDLLVEGAFNLVKEKRIEIEDSLIEKHKELTAPEVETLQKSTNELRKGLFFKAYGLSF